MRTFSRGLFVILELIVAVRVTVCRTRRAGRQIKEPSSFPRRARRRDVIGTYRFDDVFHAVLVADGPILLQPESLLWPI